jgi:hypothetical protein
VSPEYFLVARLKEKPPCSVDLLNLVCGWIRTTLSTFFALLFFTRRSDSMDLRVQPFSLASLAQLIETSYKE